MLNEFECQVRSSFYVKLLADFIVIKYAKACDWLLMNKSKL